MISADHDAAFEPGMFIGSASCEFDVPRVVPFARHIYHNRNRAYLPQLGRFAQADPNATGVRLLETACFMGCNPSNTETALNGADRYADGGSLFGYLSGNPWTNSDVMGLCPNRDGFNPMTGMYETPDNPYATAQQAFENATELMAWVTGDIVPAPSDIIRSILASMVGEYTANMMWDADWAEDWSQDDSWSTRESNLWVTVSIIRGAYDAFDIGIPFSDESINLLDIPLQIMARSGPVLLPGDNGGLKNVLKKGPQVHHIASPHSKRASDFNRIFRRAGMSMEHSANKVVIQHSGQHNGQYHDFVYKRLDNATRGLTGKAAEKALTAELDRIGKFIEKNPHFMYNTSGRRRTGWDKMRDHVSRAPGGRGGYQYRGPRRR